MHASYMVVHGPARDYSLSPQNVYSIFFSSKYCGIKSKCEYTTVKSMRTHKVHKQINKQLTIRSWETGSDASHQESESK